MLPYPQLTGSPCIVYDALQRSSNHSAYTLSEFTGYHPNTVKRALSRLQEWGLVKITHRGRGRRAIYEVQEL